MNTTPQGWYPDPAGGGGERYWDGNQWTAEVRAAASPTAAGEGAAAASAGDSAGRFLASLKTLDQARLIGLGGAVVVVLGLFLSWLSAGSQTANAFEKDLPWLLTGASVNSGGSLAHGLIYLALAVAAAVALLGRLEQVRYAALGAGGATVVLCVGNFLRFRSEIDKVGAGGSISVGYGLYLTAIGGAMVVYGALRGDLSGRIEFTGGAVSVSETAAGPDPAPTPSASPTASPAAPTVERPTLYWFHVLEAVELQSSDGRALGQLTPGSWYAAHEESGGWTSTTDDSGNTGWVASALLHRA